MAIPEIQPLLEPGDYGVVRTSGFVGWVIRTMTRSTWNHSFVYLGSGRIIEAQMQGARINALKDYGPGNLTALNFGDKISPDTRKDIVVKAESLRGTPYGFLDIFVLFLACLGIHSKRIDARINRQDRLICSQLVDRAYELAGFHLFDDGRLPSQVTPGDLGARPQVDFFDYT